MRLKKKKRSPHHVIAAFPHSAPRLTAHPACLPTTTIPCRFVLPPCLPLPLSLRLSYVTFSNVIASSLTYTTDATHQRQLAGCPRLCRSYRCTAAAWTPRAASHARGPSCPPRCRHTSPLGHTTTSTLSRLVSDTRHADTRRTDTRCTDARRTDARCVDACLINACHVDTCPATHDHVAPGLPSAHLSPAGTVPRRHRRRHDDGPRRSNAASRSARCSPAVTPYVPRAPHYFTTRLLTINPRLSSPRRAQRCFVKGTSRSRCRCGTSGNVGHKGRVWARTHVFERVMLLTMLLRARLVRREAADEQDLGGGRGVRGCRRDLSVLSRVVHVLYSVAVESGVGGRETTPAEPFGVVITSWV
jgi:hypothetical protein